MVQHTTTSALLECVKLLAIGNAFWVAPGLVPYFDLFEGFDGVRAVLNWVSTFVALVFMVRAARTAAQLHPGTKESTQGPTPSDPATAPLMVPPERDLNRRTIHPILFGILAFALIVGFSLTLLGFARSLNEDFEEVRAVANNALSTALAARSEAADAMNEAHAVGSKGAEAVK